MDDNKILVINSGSSSIKFQVISLPSEEVLIKGLCDAIGQEHAEIRYETSGKKKKTDAKPNNHEEALKDVIEIIKQEDIVASLDELKGIGHRAVHGGEMFKEPSLITDKLIKKMEKLNHLAPLHNPPNVLGMKILSEVAPSIKQVAVFDTGFHSGMPKRAYLYGLPLGLYEEDGIRRYGFHGTSHKYIGLRVSKLMERPFEELRIISCHLGNGASITAIKNGKSIDTSMGLTPLEGLVMGTRCGDIDPAIPGFLQKEKGLSVEEIDNLLNKKSGLLGLSGISADMRMVKERALEGDEKAKTARDVYAYRVKKYIGAYIAAMGSVDAVAFTAGIGENEPLIREMILEGLEGLGIILDKDKNMKSQVKISSGDSKVRIFVIPTNEELMIARETMNIVE
jgi:acetate kinase